MAQLVVRGIEERVKERLRRRARRNGRSMEEEVRHILGEAAREEQRPAQPLGSRISARFNDLGLTEDLPELREQPVRPAEFKP